MSNFIKVNHSKFELAASAIETYISRHKKNMDAAGLEVSALSLSWQGKDSEKFQNQWSKLTENDSTSEKMINALENYAKFLEFAANEYKNAQSKAINRADWL
jgi:uncharacterized protein YukE